MALRHGRRRRSPSSESPSLLIFQGLVFGPVLGASGCCVRPRILPQLARP